MNRIKLGVRLESLNLPLRAALQECARMGVTGVQVDAAGDLNPRTLSQTGRREFLHLLRSYNVELAALGCPLPRGFDIPEGLDARIDYTKKAMSLSFDLGARLAIVEAGNIPDDPAHPAFIFLSESLLALGQYGDRTGSRLALETGLEPGDVLVKFLDRFDTGSLAVNFDPANLLANGFDPFAAARALKQRIVSCHAKDTRKSSASRGAQEVPVGHGDIDWMYLLAVLEEIEFRGWMIVERETGENRVTDVAAGVKFLRRFLPSV